MQLKIIHILSRVFLVATGTFNAKYCPHVSGCRVVVTLPDSTNVFDLTGQGLSIQMTIPEGGEKQLWIVSSPFCFHQYFFVISRLVLDCYIYQ